MLFPRAFLAALAVLALAQALVITVLLTRDRPSQHIAVPACETPSPGRALSDEPCLPLSPSALRRA